MENHICDNAGNIRSYGDNTFHVADLVVGEHPGGQPWCGVFGGERKAAEAAGHGGDRQGER